MHATCSRSIRGFMSCRLVGLRRRGARVNGTRRPSVSRIRSRLTHRWVFSRSCVPSLAGSTPIPPSARRRSTSSVLTTPTRCARLAREDAEARVRRAAVTRLDDMAVLGGRRAHRSRRGCPRRGRARPGRPRRRSRRCRARHRRRPPARPRWAASAKSWSSRARTAIRRFAPPSSISSTTRKALGSVSRHAPDGADAPARTGPPDRRRGDRQRRAQVRAHRRRRRGARARSNRRTRCRRSRSAPATRWRRAGRRTRVRQLEEAAQPRPRSRRCR